MSLSTICGVISTKIPVAVDVILTCAFTSFRSSLATQLGVNPLLPSPVRTSVLPATPEIPDVVMLVLPLLAFPAPTDDVLLYPAATL